MLCVEKVIVAVSWVVVKEIATPWIATGGLCMLGPSPVLLPYPPSCSCIHDTADSSGVPARISRFGAS